MSTIKKNLGRLEPVDLREIWVSESGDFTPWLVKEDNLTLLGDTIGIELELEAQEKNVGPFRADILCKDTATNGWVIIENQLECTDHNHLGQLLTYAAGLKAATVVWIAKEFTDEHRAALDWLNELLSGSVNFFGIEIELWQIAGSPIAPRFNILCQPNDWSGKIIPPPPITETKLLQQEYWAALRKLLLERKSVVKPQKPLPQHWTNFAIGRAYFGMFATVNTQKAFIKVGVDCSGPDGKTHFALLQKEKDVIENLIGCPLEWKLRTNSASITLCKMDVDPTNREDWPSQHLWLAEKIESFYKVFAPRVKELSVDEDQDVPDEE